MTPEASEPTVLVLDFGAQYAQLIARRVREAHVRSEIVSSEITADEVRARRPIGLILSGGPASVYADDAYRMDPAILELGIPILGICYGHQLLAVLADGEVAHTGGAEFGKTDLEVTGDSVLLAGLPVDPAGLDVAQRRGHDGSPRLRLRRPDGRSRGGGDGGPRARSLWRPVPPRGGPHSTGH